MEFDDTAFMNRVEIYYVLLQRKLLTRDKLPILHEELTMIEGLAWKGKILSI